MDIIYMNKLIKQLLNRLKNPNEDVKDILVTSMIVTNVSLRLATDKTEIKELTKILKKLDKCNKMLMSEYIIVE